MRGAKVFRLGMTTLLDAPNRGRVTCGACGKAIEPGEPVVRIHGDALHRDCTVYRSRRSGQAPR